MSLDNVLFVPTNVQVPRSENACNCRSKRCRFYELEHVATGLLTHANARKLIIDEIQHLDEASRMRRAMTESVATLVGPAGEYSFACDVCIRYQSISTYPAND
jgi:hypothetical protein